MNLKCDNCDYVCTDGNANLVKDLLQRVESGGIMPGGECPKCTALMYPTKEPTVKQCYKAGECPDCQLEIPDLVGDQDACENCGHVFCHQKKCDDAQNEKPVTLRLMLDVTYVPNGTTKKCLTDMLKATLTGRPTTG